jgi:hypothetical protein
MSAEFPRLESVRARHRSRRRWVRAVAVFGTVAGLIVLAWIAVPEPLLLVLRQATTPLSPAASRIVDAHGEARGRVKTVEPHLGIIQVSSDFLGLMSVALFVTPETLIVVGDKEGGLGDIRPGERIVATYEVRRGVLEARRVEMFPRMGPGN